MMPFCSSLAVRVALVVAGLALAKGCGGLAPSTEEVTVKQSAAGACAMPKQSCGANTPCCTTGLPAGLSASNISCFGTGATQTCCTGDGGPCNATADCCGAGQCVAGRCQVQCKNHDHCSDNGECCGAEQCLVIEGAGPKNQAWRTFKSASALHEPGDNSAGGLCFSCQSQLHGACSQGGTTAGAGISIIILEDIGPFGLVIPIPEIVPNDTVPCCGEGQVCGDSRGFKCCLFTSENPTVPGALCTNTVDCCGAVGETGNIGVERCVALAPGLPKTCQQCFATSQACTSGEQCCSESCLNGRCACTKKGSTCARNEQCCSGACASSVCVDPASSGGVVVGVNPGDNTSSGGGASSTACHAPTDNNNTCLSNNDCCPYTSFCNATGHCVAGAAGQACDPNPDLNTAIHPQCAAGLGCGFKQSTDGTSGTSCIPCAGDQEECITGKGLNCCASDITAGGGFTASDDCVFNTLTQKGICAALPSSCQDQPLGQCRFQTPGGGAPLVLGCCPDDPAQLAPDPCPSDSDFCGQSPPMPSPLPSQLDAGETLAFESTVDWSVQNGSLALNTHATDGVSSLQVRAHGWTPVTTKALSTTEVRAMAPAGTKTATYDLYIAPGQPNPYWVGATQLYASMPSAGIYNACLGQVELTGLPQGQFDPMTFNLPSNLVGALGGTHGDLTFTIVLNVVNGSPPFLLDHFRFH